MSTSVPPDQPAKKTSSRRSRPKGFPHLLSKSADTLIGQILSNVRSITLSLSVISLAAILALVLFPLLFRASGLSRALVQVGLGVILLLLVIYGNFFVRRMQSALRWSEERYRLVNYATNDVIWDWDLHTNEIGWSQSLQRTFGYASQEPLRNAAWWEENIHPDDRDKVMASIRQAITGRDEFWSKEYRFQRADGGYAHVFDRGYVITDEQGVPDRMIGAMMDITSWRQAEQDLASERNLLRTLVDQLPDRIYIKDTESRFLLKNLADVQAMGAKSTKEVEGKTDFDYYPKELAEKYFADDQATIQSGQALVNQIEPGIDENGNPCWILTTKMPLRNYQNKVIGLIGIGRDITESKKMEESLQQANRQLNAWINDLEQRSREISLLNQMSFLLQSCSTEEEAYKVIGELGRLLFPEESGGLYVTSASRNLVELVASWGDPLPGESVFKPDDCWGLRLGQLHASEGYVETGGSLPEGAPKLACNHIEPPAPQAYLCVPLMAQSESLGVLHIRRVPESDGQWFTEVKQQLARTVGSNIALALANQKLRDTLRQQSIRDPLTGLFNRRYMEETIEREVHRVSRTKQPVGIIMMDVDRFKRFNDVHGHDAGDLVLHELGAFLRSSIRGEDIACRYGGEEFVLIMPGAPLEVVRERAEILREGIKGLHLRYRDQPLEALTVSLGVASFPEHGPNAEATIRAADSALRIAKKTGRDRVVSAKETQSAQKTGK